MRVTLDTNVLDRACRPERSSDANEAVDQKVNGALKSGCITGCYSATLLTIEAITRADRSKVMTGTRLKQQSERVSVTNGSDIPSEIREWIGSGDVETITVEYKVVQPRPKIHPEFARRALAAKVLGLRVIRTVPRNGAFNIEDPTGEFYIPDADRGDLSMWIATIHTVSSAIEDRGVGLAQLKEIGQKLSVNSHEAIWFRSLDKAGNIHDERAVDRAFAEWPMVTAWHLTSLTGSTSSVPTTRGEATLLARSWTFTIVSGSLPHTASGS